MKNLGNFNLHGKKSIGLSCGCCCVENKLDWIKLKLDKEEMSEGFDDYQYNFHANYELPKQSKTK